MAQIDFATVKAAVSFEDAITFLGLKMTKKGKTYRSACPSCQKGDDRSLAVTPGEGFYCHALKKGGDVISLVAHVRNCSQREAAGELQDRFIGATPVPRRADTPQQNGELDDQLDKIAARLDFAHPAVDALGLSEEVASALGIGYDPRNKRVMMPLHTDKRVGFAGLATSPEQSPLILFNKNLEELCAARPEVADDKIVDFKKFYRAS